MKLIKMFGICALAALMAMAFVGAGSAMAEPTSLCTEDPGEGEVCSEGKWLTHLHEATAAGAPAVMKTSILTFKCDVLSLGNMVKGLGKPLEIEGNITVSNCSSGCLASEISVQLLAKVLRSGHESADVEIEVEGNVHCGLLLNCNYDASGVLGHTIGALLSSAKNGETSFEEQTLNKTGGLLCPKTAELSVLTSPLSAFYVTG
jgi:hypothetical protein